MQFMKYFIFILSLTVLSACSVQQKTITQNGWKDVAVIHELEVYVDTISIKQEENYHYAYIKNVYMTENSHAAYIDKLRKAYSKDKNVENKLKKWDDFSYNISYCEYDCANKRYRILEIADYDRNGNLIVKTKTDKTKSKWLNVGIDTMGDYTLFFVCDYTSN